MVSRNPVCVACGSLKLGTVSKLNDHTFAVCCSCGTGNVYPRYAEKTEDMYPESYYNLLVLSRLNTTLKQKIFYNNRITQIERFIKTGVVLDFGCGDGSFISAFQQKRWKRYGHDTSSAALNITKTRGVEIYNYQPNTILDDIKIDVITCIHVLEHLDEPKKYLLDFINRLNKGRYLLIEVPNFSSPWSKLFKNKWPPNADVPRHLTHFSLSGLTTLLKDCNFEAVKETDSLLGNFLFTYYLFFVLIKETVRSTWAAFLATALLSPLIALYACLGNKDSIQILFRKVA